jgi:hypothetical protein
MDDNPGSPLEQAIGRVTDLEAELEASSEAAAGGEALARAREVLHRWVDSVTAVVATPGASPDLPVLLSVPVTWSRDE